MTKHKTIVCPAGHPYSDIAGQLLVALDRHDSDRTSEEVAVFQDVLYTVLDRWRELNGHRATPESLMEAVEIRAAEQNEWLTITADACNCPSGVGRLRMVGEDSDA